MYEFHTNKEVYFKWQFENARDYVIPFIEKKIPITFGMKVLEVGCGEGGVLKAFVERGCEGTGVELSESRVESAKAMNQDLVADGKVRFMAKDIYNPAFAKEFEGQFDLIILKDVIEHIHDQQKLMSQLRRYLNHNGKIFFGFPPWYMPFGGHQQLSRKKFLSRLPYYHLLPMPMYRGFLRLFGESKEVIEGLAEVKETGISIERFERICKKLEMPVVSRTIYLINPIYKFKFKWKPRKQNVIISRVPYIRDFLSTCVYYLIGKK